MWGCKYQNHSNFKCILKTSLQDDEASIPQEQHVRSSATVVPSGIESPSLEPITVEAAPTKPVAPLKPSKLPVPKKKKEIPPSSRVLRPRNKN